MGTPGGYTPFFNLILPTVGGNAVEWATWTNQNWTTVDAELQALADGKVSLNPVNGTLYGRRNNEWVAIDVDGGTVTVGIAEAPNDGNPYLRQSLGWVGATAVIQGIVDASVVSELTPIVRRVDTPGTIVVPNNQDVISESISHSLLRNSTIKVRYVGTLTPATGAGSSVVRFQISFGATLVFEAFYSVTDLPLTSVIPFVLDFDLSDYANTQYASGVASFADQDMTLGGVSGQSFTKNGAVAPTVVSGGPFVSDSTTFDLTGVGTKNLTVNIANLVGDLTVNLLFANVKREVG